MFEKVNIPIIGIVENMAMHTCSKCGNEEHIFGSGGAKKMCQDYGVSLLARDERYGLKEQEYYEVKAERVMIDTLQKVQTDIYNPLMPFSEKGYSLKRNITI